MKRMLVGKLILLFLTLLVSHALAADDVIYGCYKSKNKSGSELRIVSDPSQCKKGETSVTLCTECGGTDSGYKYKVYDADNHYLGLSNEKYLTTANLLIKGLNKSAVVRETECGSGDISEVQFFYEDFDCTGKEYLAYTYGLFSGFLTPALEENETRIGKSRDADQYFYGENPGYKKYRSFITPWGYCQNEETTKCAFLWEANKIPELDIPFTLPVALPLHYEPNN